MSSFKMVHGGKTSWQERREKEKKKKKNHGMYKNCTGKYPMFLIPDFFIIDYKINVI